MFDIIITNCIILTWQLNRLNLSELIALNISKQTKNISRI